MQSITKLIDNTKDIINKIKEREDTITEIKDGLLYKKIKKYNSIFDTPDPPDPFNKSITRYKPSTATIKSFNMNLFNLSDFSVENINETTNVPKNYSELTFDSNIIKEIRNKYASLDFSNYESLFNNLTFSNQIITLSSTYYVNQSLNKIIRHIGTPDAEDVLLDDKNSVLKTREDRIKSIKWTWGKKQVEEARTRQRVDEKIKNDFTKTLDPLYTTVSKQKISIHLLVTYVIVLLIKGITFNNKLSIGEINDEGNIIFGKKLNIYAIVRKLQIPITEENKYHLCDTFLGSANNILLNGKRIFFYLHDFKTLKFHDQVDTSLFADFSSISKYKDVFSLSYDDLFKNVNSQIIAENEDDNKRNAETIASLHRDNLAEVINSINLVINIVKIYSKKSEINEMYKQITDIGPIIGGDITYIKNNLLFDKNQILKYLDNLGQLSVLNETIRQNDKILDKVNFYKEYIRYFKSIIDIIDSETFDNDQLIKKVLINYRDCNKIDNNTANKIYDKLDKDKDLVILLSLNDIYINLLNKI